MEKKKITFKERFNAFLVYWRENWKKDCIFGFLCLALGFCIARCTSKNEIVSADELQHYSLEEIAFYDVGGIYQIDLSLTETYAFFLSNSTASFYIFNGDNYYNGTLIRHTDYAEFIFDTYYYSMPKFYDYYLLDFYTSIPAVFDFTSPVYLLSTSETVFQVYRFIEVPASSIPEYDGLNSYDIFNGAVATYSFSSSTSGISSQQYIAPVDIDMVNNRVMFNTLFSQIPATLKELDFIEPAGQFPASFKGSDQLRLTIPYEGDIDLYSIVVYFYPSYNSYNAVSNDSFVKIPDGSFVNLSISDYGTLSIIDNVSPKGRFLQLTFGGFFGYDTSGNIFAAPIISVLDNMYLSYGSVYDFGYAAGVSSMLEQISFDYQSAYNDGYNTAYITTDVLSPNYVAGYNAGLSNADGSWVLSPVNAVNTLMSLELFSVGDFHFKLSYLVYLTFGGLLVGILMRFLFHS